MRLLADCGNTTIKLALARDAGIWQFARLDPLPDRLSAFIQPFERTIEELAVMPGAKASTQVLEHWWSTAGRGRPIRLVGDANLPVPDLGQYPNCGIDRVLSGLAACAQERKPLVVVDAGTATTITAWTWQPELGDPTQAVRFVGGLILPSARTCAAGLAAQAPALPVVEPLGPDAHACQRDTVGSIGAALGIGYGPMVAACLLKLERETAIRTIISTGGNTGLLIDSQVLPRLAYRPSLVLEGLEVLCGVVDKAARKARA